MILGFTPRNLAKKLDEATILIIKTGRPRSLMDKTVVCGTTAPCSTHGGDTTFFVLRYFFPKISLAFSAKYTLAIP